MSAAAICTSYKVSTSCSFIPGTFTKYVNNCFSSSVSSFSLGTISLGSAPFSGWIDSIKRSSSSSSVRGWASSVPSVSSSGFRSVFPIGPWRNSSSALLRSSSVTSSSSSASSISGCTGISFFGSSSGFGSATFISFISPLRKSGSSSSSEISWAFISLSSTSVSELSSCTSSVFDSSSFGISIPCALAAARIVSSRFNSFPSRSKESIFSFVSATSSTFGGLLSSIFFMDSGIFNSGILIAAMGSAPGFSGSASNSGTFSGSFCDASLFMISSGISSSLVIPASLTISMDSSGNSSFSS